MKCEEAICRAVTFPVAEPIGSTWPELRKALDQVWRDSTALANWAVVELAKCDLVLVDSSALVPPMPSVILYERFTGFKTQPKKGKRRPKERIGPGYPGRDAWAGNKGAVASVLRRIQRKYARERGKVWRGRQALPTARYPQPYPIPSKGWSPAYIEGQSAKVAAVKIVVAGKAFCLRLKSGPEFARQLAMFRLLVDGAKRGEASIRQQRSHGQDHVMLKLVGWFPKPSAKEGHTLLVRTTPESFWVCEREGRREWIINADQVRRRVEAHRCFRQRISEDMKAERRSSQKPGGAGQALEKRCQKQNNFLDSKAHEYSAQLVRFAERQGAATIIYDDTCREYLASFPWHDLKTKLAYKCEAAGITFVHRDGVQPPIPQEDEKCPSLQETAELVRMTGRLSRRRNASRSLPTASATASTSNGSVSGR